MPAHTDDQDVFVLQVAAHIGLQPGYVGLQPGLQPRDQHVLLPQLAGCKHWRVYRTPLPLPYSHEQLGKDHASPLTSEMLGDPILEVRPPRPARARALTRSTASPLSPAPYLPPPAPCQLRLQPGELLYLPRGAPHEARADEGASSLHITLTAQSSDLTWASLVLDGMQELHRRHAPFRHALPMAMLSSAQAGRSAQGAQAAQAAQGAQGAQGEGLDAQWEARWKDLMRHSAEQSAEAYAAALRRLHAKIAKHNADQDAALRLLTTPAEARGPRSLSPTSLLEEMRRSV